MQSVILLVGTQKGAFLVRSADARASWEASAPIFLGHNIYHIVADPREPGRVLMAATTGHLGPTVFRSKDYGNTWKEATQPPAFPPSDQPDAKAVKFVFWLTPGHPSQPGVWYAGTGPQGLFITDDHGETWASFTGFNEYPEAQKWMDNLGTPIGPVLHSINVDPRDPGHIYLGMSQGGCIETQDGGQTWHPLNQGVLADFLPNPYPEYGQCVHNLQLSLADPDVLYQQNHCGVYRLNRVGGDKWDRVGANIPDKIGDMGFPLILHPRDPDTLWVFPMDGSDVWPRTCVGGRPAFYRSKDGGQRWQRQDRGFPQANAWFTVMRQATAHDFQKPLGLYVGNKQGEIWASFDEGESWANIVRYLPPIYSIEVMLGPDEA